MTVVINEEHLNLWAWMGQIVSSVDGNPLEYFSSEEHQLKMLFYHTIRCALVSGEPRNRNILTLSQNEMASDSLRSVSYLSFPLLEGILRKICNNFVDYSGKVKKQFNGHSRKYKIGSRCNSIEDMMYLYQNEIIGDSTKLDCLLQYVHDLSSDGEQHAFKTIYIWRNSSLHGDVGAFSIIGGIVLNIALFILLNSIKDNYIFYRDKALKNALFYEDAKNSLLFYKPNSNDKINISLGQKK